MNNNFMQTCLDFAHELILSTESSLAQPVAFPNFDLLLDCPSINEANTLKRELKNTYWERRRQPYIPTIHSAVRMRWVEIERHFQANRQIGAIRSVVFILPTTRQMLERWQLTSGVGTTLVSGTHSYLCSLCLIQLKGTCVANTCFVSTCSRLSCNVLQVRQSE